MSTLVDQPGQAKTAAAILANKLFHGESNMETLQPLFTELGYVTGHPDNSLPEPLIDDKKRVGIWVEDVEIGDGSLKRDDRYYAEWRLWANIHRISPKGHKRRVVLLGESVARGYLYDPHYNPALALAEMLSLNQAQYEYDVIDLARTNLDLHQLTALTADCLKLSPDYIVVFAGNNWNLSMLDNFKNSDYAALAGVVQQLGIIGLQETLECSVKEKVNQYMRHLTEISKKAGVPVIFVIPEFNLLDWKSSPSERITPFFEHTQEWVCAAEKGFAALASDELSKACEYGERLVELDPSHPCGYEILATVALKNDDLRSARTWLEKAKDTAIFMRSSSKPRIYNVTREAIGMWNGESVRVVDLSQVFFDYTRKLPDRELFLDYCHLTVTGIKIAMAGVLQAIVEKSLGLKLALDQISKGGDPEKEVCGMAHFCAAVHNAHFGQSYDILHYHCKEAVDVSMLCVKYCMRYVDFASRRTATILCSSHEDIQKSGDSVQYEGGLGFLHDDGRKIMDLELVNAMVDALSNVGLQIGKQIDQLRLEQHGLSRPINLLESFYHLTSYERFMGNEYAYYKSRSSSSLFHFFCNGDERAVLRVTIRTANLLPEQGEVIIMLNEKELARLSSLPKWSSQRVSIMQGQLVKGKNNLRLIWPAVSSNRKAQLFEKLAPADLLELMYPAFGELHSLTIEKI